MSTARKAYLLGLRVRGSSMTFTVDFTSGETITYDDRARYSIGDSGCLHITTPDQRSVHSSQAWIRVIEQHDPREPSSRFV